MKEWGEQKDQSCSAHSHHTLAGKAGSSAWSSTGVRRTEREERQVPSMLAHPVLSASLGRFLSRSCQQTAQTLSWMRRTTGHFCKRVLLSLISLFPAFQQALTCLPLPPSTRGCFRGGSVWFQRTLTFLIVFRNRRIQLYLSLTGTSGKQTAPTSPAPNFRDSSPFPVPQDSQPNQ